MTKKPSRLKATHGKVDRYPYIFIVFVSIAITLWDKYIPHIHQRHYRKVVILFNFLLKILFPVKTSSGVNIDDYQGLLRFIEILKEAGLNELATEYEETISTHAIGGKAR